MTLGISLFEILQKEPHFLGVELDSGLGVPFDAVVLEIVLKYFS